MEYREFIFQVQASGKLASFEEAEATTLAVMRALAEVLRQERAASMQTYLPAELFWLFERRPAEADPFIDSQTFIGWVSGGLDAIGMPDKTLGGLDLFTIDAADEAVRRCGSVFSVLKSGMDSSLHEAFARELPEEVRDWFRAA